MAGEFIMLEEFQAILPSLMGEKTRAVFATYNGVGGVYGKGGEIETGLPNLSIMVQNGNLQYSPMVYMINVLSGFDIDQFDLMKSEAAKAQYQVSENVTNDPLPKDTKLLAFIYAGLSGPKGAGELAEEIRKNHPEATIVLTMCDCGVRRHKDHLIDLVNAGVADYLVYNLECGGFRLMKDLLEAVKKAAHDQAVSAV